MVKRTDRIVTGAHYGIKDWLIQRVTAVLMVVYTILIIAILYVFAPNDYFSWKSIFETQWIRFATVLFLLSVFLHAWIGIRDVLMDYVKSTAMRLMLHVLVILALLFYLIWSVEILWS